MKKLLIFLIIISGFLSLYGCSSPTLNKPDNTVINKPVDNPGPVDKPEPKDEKKNDENLIYPEKIIYDRMWIYSAHAEITNPETIKAITDIIRSFEKGEVCNGGVTDFTDILIFMYADGSIVRFEFEAYCLVSDDNIQYQVIGDLGGLRKILDYVLEN